MSAFAHKIWPLADLDAANVASDGPFHVFLDEDTMSAELFQLPAGGVDTQTPHDLDELYYVISGRASFTADDDTRTVTGGETIYVRAHVPHRFHDIEQDLSVLVVFSKKDPSA